MGDPRRLNETDALARLLYEANRADAAPAEVRDRVLGLVGSAAVGGAALAASSTTLAPSLEAANVATGLAKGAAAKLALLKIALGSLVAAAGAYGGYQLAADSSAPPGLRVPAPSDSPASQLRGSSAIRAPGDPASSSNAGSGGAPVGRPTPNAETERPVPISPTASSRLAGPPALRVEQLPLELTVRRPLRPQGEIPSTNSKPAASESASVPEFSLKDEVALVSQARSQLNEGRHREARQTLTLYRQRFPAGKLEPETLELSRRIDAAEQSAKGK